MAIRVTETGAGFEELIGGHEVTATISKLQQARL